ncbi:MAG: tRNA-dependent cyclodipeptide synthase [Pseudonocardiaceae bacterium]
MSSFHVRPLCGRCRPPLASRANACFGISPFNSYFTTGRLTDLARWGLREFTSVRFFVPDAPAAYTLEALGYSPDRAVHKARRQRARMETGRRPRLRRPHLAERTRRPATP